MNENRCLAREHIVRVLRGPALPAYLQVSACFGIRWRPWLCGEIRGCCRRYCRQRLGLHGRVAAGVVSAKGDSIALLPRPLFDADESADGLLVELVAALGAVSGDPKGQFVGGVQRA
ncbi:hypothetical protein GCM10009576_032660 [Streptomyces rhizosphaericus]|uniref:Uncharacterized protein n=2 Tax=Streptomyces rhizosphaericus TaxID=114699 RepID=A0ABP4A685_9ACTN